MELEEGRKALTNIVENYVNDQEQVDRLRNIIYSEPPRVPIRGIMHEIEIHHLWNQPITPEDREILDDLFHFFG